MFSFGSVNVTRGKSEFDKKWGKMVLEDNCEGHQITLFVDDIEETSGTTNQNLNYLMNWLRIPCDNKDLLESMNDNTLIAF